MIARCHLRNFVGPNNFPIEGRRVKPILDKAEDIPVVTKVGPHLSRAGHCEINSDAWIFLVEFRDEVRNYICSDCLARVDLQMTRA